MPEYQTAIHLGVWTSPNGRNVSVDLDLAIDFLISTPEGALARGEYTWFLNDVLPEVLGQMREALDTTIFQAQITRWMSDSLQGER